MSILFGMFAGCVGCGFYLMLRSIPHPNREIYALEKSRLDAQRERSMKAFDDYCRLLIERPRPPIQD